MGTSPTDWAAIAQQAAPTDWASLAGKAAPTDWASLAKAAAPTGAEEPTPAAEPTITGTDWASLARAAAPPQDPTEPEAFNETLKYAGNPVTEGLTAEERRYAAETEPTEMEDEPWYSKAWEWLNSPLWDLRQYGTREGAGAFERGIETGLEDLGSGLTSPLQIALTLGTFGGAALEKLGLSAANVAIRDAGLGLIKPVLKTIGVAEEAAPVVANAAKAMMGLGFTGQMIGGLMTQSPEFLDALKDGDTERAAELGTNLVGTGALLALGGHQFIEDAKTVKDVVSGKAFTNAENIKKAAEIAGQRDERIARGSDDTQKKVEAVARLMDEAGILKDPEAMRAIMLHMESGGEIDTLQKLEGVIDGTIKPRERTAEEHDQMEKGAELRAWADESNDFFKNKDGSPTWMHAVPEDEAFPGTKNFGQTLLFSGDPAEANYVQIKNPKLFASGDALDNFIQKIATDENLDHESAQAAARVQLQNDGYDGAVIAQKEGRPVTIAFDSAQLRPVAAFKQAADSAWNRDLVYVAVDKKFDQMIKNSGLKSARREELQYHATPEEALKNATLPDSGNPKDLNVYAVPRSEVEGAIHTARAAEQKAAGAAGGFKLKSIDASETDDAGNPVSKAVLTTLHDETGKQVGSVHMAISDDGTIASINDTHLNKGIRDNVRGYGKAMYLEAMKEAKARGVKTIYNDMTGATSPDAQRVWDSLIKEFGGKKGVTPGTEATPGSPIEFPRYTIDLYKHPTEAFEHKLEPGREGPKELINRPIGDDELVVKKTHMPAYQLELDEGKPTGRSTPLRPYGAEALPQDSSRFNNTHTVEEKAEWKKAFQRAQKLTDKEKEISQTLRALYDGSFETMFRNGLIREWVQAYHPHAWADQSTGFLQGLFKEQGGKVTSTVLNQLRDDTQSGRFDTNVNQAKQRVYKTLIQGLMAGEKWKSDDLLMHLTKHLRATEEALANKEYLENMIKKGVRSADGKPAAVVLGNTKRVGGEENPALFMKPEAQKSVAIHDDIIKDMREGTMANGKTKLEDALDSKTILRLPWDHDVEQPDGTTRKEPTYTYNTEGYATIDHYATRAWKYAGQDTGGNPAFMHGDVMFHPDFVKEVERVIGADRSIFRDNKILRGIGAASREAKGLLFSLSPFHLAQEALRGMMAGLNPLDYGHITLEENPLLALGVKNGLDRHMFGHKDQFSGDYSAHSKLIGKVKGLRTLQSWFQDFLFDKYIPGLKDRAYLKFHEQIAEANKALTPDQVASRAADLANDMFGGQKWRKLGWSTQAQDFAKMAMLAPDWAISEGRMIGRAFGLMDKETGALSRKMLLKQMAVMWGVSRVLNLMVSGELHNEAMFGVASKDDNGQEKVYSIRTLPTDILHALSDPEGFMRNRVNPLVVHPMVEAYTGRDAMGRRVTWETQASDAWKNIVPMSMQGIFKNTGLGVADQFIKGAGLSVNKYNTQAEKMANQYASDRMPSGPVDPANLKAHQENLRLEDALRQGYIGAADVRQAVSKRRADEIIRRQHMTPLQARVDRLPLAEIVDVWSAATAREKTELSGLIWKKRNEYIKQHTPRERATDPTWHKLQSIHGDIR